MWKCGACGFVCSHAQAQEMAVCRFPGDQFDPPDWAFPCPECGDEDGLEEQY